MGPVYTQVHLHSFSSFVIVSFLTLVMEWNCLRLVLLTLLIPSPLPLTHEIKLKLGFQKSCISIPAWSSRQKSCKFKVLGMNWDKMVRKSQRGTACEASNASLPQKGLLGYMESGLVPSPIWIRPDIVMNHVKFLCRVIVFCLFFSMFCISHVLRIGFYS